jgi:hypothetical protein
MQTSTKQKPLTDLQREAALAIAQKLFKIVRNDSFIAGNGDSDISFAIVIRAISLLCVTLCINAFSHDDKEAFCESSGDLLANIMRSTSGILGEFCAGNIETIENYCPLIKREGTH